MTSRLAIPLFVAGFLSGFPIEAFATWVGVDLMSLSRDLRMQRLAPAVI